MKHSLFYGFSIFAICFVILSPSHAMAADPVSIIYSKLTENLKPEFIRAGNANLKEYQKRARYVTRLLRKQEPSAQDWSDMRELIQSVRTSADRVLPSHLSFVKGWLESELNELLLLVELKDWNGLRDTLSPMLKAMSGLRLNN